MICGNCGNNASWRDNSCHKCNLKLHQKNCKARSPDCKCHAFNQTLWMTKKSATTNA